MTQETSLVANDEMEELQRQLAQGSNERVDTFSTMPTITVSNQSQEPSTPGEGPGVKPGSMVSSIKTENGYVNEEFPMPFQGVVLRQRMYLRTKYEAVKNGAPKLVTDEFDSYKDSEIITVKKQNIEGKWEEDFVGNYKQVVAHYSDTNSFGKVNKYLDLQYNLYVCVSLAEKRIVRIQVKGKSRGALFDFMKTFTRKAGDFMSSTWTTFATEEHLNDFNGKPLKFPVWSFKYTKGEKLDILSLKAAITLQNELNEEISAREAAFGKKEYAQIETASHAELPQGSPEEEIPTINLDEEETEEIKIQDVPFKN